MNIEEFKVNFQEEALTYYEISALLAADSSTDSLTLLGTRDTYIWSSLILDLINVTGSLEEKGIEEALNHALNAYKLAQEELLASGLDFISYLNNRHVPLKDLIIEFVDYVFKHNKEDNNEHYLSYVYDIIAFIEKAYIKSNDALNNLKLKGYLEETFTPCSSINFDLIPASYFTATKKGKTVLAEIQSRQELPAVIQKLLSFESIYKKVYSSFFSCHNLKA